MNKYYEMFINENVDETLLKVNPNGLSFEDHFWHSACMAIYYLHQKDFYMHTKYLTACCDLNYFYNAFIYFDAYGVLPSKFKKYTNPFEHKMKDDKLEALIAAANKKDKKHLRNQFMGYSFATLLIVPFMFLLVFVFKISTSIAATVSIILLLIGQMMINPMVRHSRQKKSMKRDSLIPQEERNFFSFMAPFNSIAKDERYAALISSDSEEERQIIVKAIKSNKPLPEEIRNKKQEEKKTKKDKKSKNNKKGIEEK